MAHRGKARSSFDTRQYANDTSEDDDSRYVNSNSGSSGGESESEEEAEKTAKPRATTKGQGGRKKRKAGNARSGKSSKRGRTPPPTAIVGEEASSVTTKQKRTQKKTPARVSYGTRVGTINSPEVGDVSVLSGMSALESVNNSLRKENSTLLQQVERMKTFMSQGGGGGKSAARTLKKKDFMKCDLANVKALNSFIASAIWPKIKIMPKNWHVWNASPKSACSQMLSKVTVPVGMTPTMYWKEMLCVFANDKLCATRANFKMSLLQRYKGM